MMVVRVMMCCRRRQTHIGLNEGIHCICYSRGIDSRSGIRRVRPCMGCLPKMFGSRHGCFNGGLIGKVIDGSGSRRGSSRFFGS